MSLPPIQPGAALYTQGFGTRPENVEVPHLDVRDPTTQDVGFPIGKQWLNQLLLKNWILDAITASNGSLSATWVELISNGGGSVLGVPNGGTGRSTLTLHGVLIGEGTNPVDVTAAGTDGQVLTANSGADPSFQNIGSKSGLTAHGVVVAEGTSAFAATAAGTTGQVLTATTSADPAFAALGTNSGLTAHGVLLGEGTGAIVATTAGSSGQVLIGSTGADPAFGTLTTSTGVTFTGGAAALAVDLKQGGFKINAASAGVPLVAQNSYTVTQAGQASFSLPATATPGDMFLIASGTGNTGGWIITQGASQEIWSGTSHTTNGATGTLAGAIHTSVLLMCVVANVDFIVLGNTTGYSFT